MPLTNGGFETGSFWDGWNGNVGTLEVVTSPVRSGTYALRASTLTENRAWVSYNPSPMPNDMTLTAFFQIPVPLPANSYILISRLSDSNNIGEVDAVVGTDPNGNPWWGLARPNGSQNPYETFLEAVPAVILPNTWYKVTIRRVVGNGNGIASLKINDAELLSNTSETILNPTYLAIVGIVYADALPSSLPFFVDDVSVIEVVTGVQISTNGPFNAAIGQVIPFSVSVSGGNPPYAFTIDWGDGTNTQGTWDTAGTYTWDINYATEGTFTISIVVNGSVANTTVTVGVPQPDILLPLAVVSASVVGTALVVKFAGKKKRRKRR